MSQEDQITKVISQMGKALTRAFQWVFDFLSSSHFQQTHRWACHHEYPRSRIFHFKWSSIPPVRRWNNPRDRTAHFAPSGRWQSSMADAGILLLDSTTSLGCVIYTVFRLIKTNWKSLGFSSVFGVFQEFYSTHDVLKGNKADLATVGTTSTVGSIHQHSPVIQSDAFTRVFFIFYRLSHSLFWLAIHDFRRIVLLQDSLSRWLDPSSRPSRRKCGILLQHKV